MSGFTFTAASRPTVRAVSMTTVATVVSYAALGAALLATRLLFLGHSFWHDEIYTVVEFIRPGPTRIFAGPELNHELFSVLAWAGQFVLGKSEVSYRLWSAVPFVLGVALATAWLHVRVRALAGILFLFLATVSPLLLDITREARGYGLVFFAMALMTVAALEVDHAPRTSAVVAFCIGGVIGTWTLPQFGIAFVAMGLVLLRYREVRRSVPLGLSLSLLAIAVWYAPHVAQLQTVSQNSGRVQIHTAWLLTAPIDQVVIPSLVWIDGVAERPGIVLLPVIAALVLLMASGPLARNRRTLLLLSAGAYATVAVLWIAQTYTVPRYLSYLLVPGFMLLASGMAHVFGAIGLRRVTLRTLVGFVVLVLLAVRFVTLSPDIVLLPRVAHRDAADAVRRSLPANAPVFAYMHTPSSLAFYLGWPVRAVRPPDVAASVCRNPERVAYVMQPFSIRPVVVPCLHRDGVVHYVFRQYARGGEMNVWIVPPARLARPGSGGAPGDGRSGPLDPVN